MGPRSGRALVLIALLVAAACSGNDAASGPTRSEEAHGLDLVTLPAPPAAIVTAPEQRTRSWATPVAAAPSKRSADVAAIGEHGHLGSLTNPTVDDTWVKWRARPSLDGSTAIMTLSDEAARTIDRTLLSWVTLPSAAETGRLEIDAPSELNAVSGNGDLVALTNFAAPMQTGEIAGAKTTTTLWIADRNGVRYEAELDGNFVAEAFGRSLGADGLPEHVFLLEHFPADAPRFYRVRVLSTATGDVSLPLNLRDKSQQVDERMSGLSRSQVISDDHGLLFTLYRGTIDGTPDGDPYAFVHTLDLADGVWCIFLDPALELDTLPGTIAVGGDRLYVASANGHVGSIPIPSISDPDRNPTMDWVVSAGSAADEPPVLLADHDGVWVAVHDGSGELVHISADGMKQAGHAAGGPNPTALTFDETGDLIVAGAGWSTLGEVDLPTWFGAPAALFTQ